MSTSREQVELRLRSLGLSADNMYLLPDETGEEGLIALWYPEIGIRFLILENEPLAKACYRYLLDRGNRKFVSSEQLLQTAAKERWQGWDTCEPLVRAHKT